MYQHKDIESNLKNINLSQILYSDKDIDETHFCKVTRNDPWDNAELSKKIFAQTSKNIEKTGWETKNPTFCV